MHLRRPWILVTSAMCGFFTCAVPRPCFAYGTDVHFNLTYILCRLADLPEKDALWIAAANESMDHNTSTSAWYDGVLTQGVWVQNGINWHCFTSEGASPTTGNDRTHTITYVNPDLAKSKIKGRLNELWANVDLQYRRHFPGDSQRDRTIAANIAMGQFLHFEQDYFSHRQLTGYLDEKTWLPYGPFLGHVLDGEFPDYVVAREDLAESMVEDTYFYIRHFSQMTHHSPQQPPPTLLVSLIHAIASSYTLPPPLPPQPNGDNTPPAPPLHLSLRPSQSDVNKKLSPHISMYAWSTNLPTFTDKCKYQLPYDNAASIPLKEVRRIFGD